MVPSGAGLKAKDLPKGGLFVCAVPSAQWVFRGAFGFRKCCDTFGGLAQRVGVNRLTSIYFAATLGARSGE